MVYCFHSLRSTSKNGELLVEPLHRDGVPCFDRTKELCAFVHLLGLVQTNVKSDDTIVSRK